MLRRAGLQVTVYDRYDRSGGLMVYGIPGFKLEKDVVMRRNAQLEDGGVEFVLNCDVGDDITFEDIRAKHDFVVIATGVYKSRDLPAPGVGAQGIVRAIDYLTASNRVASATRCRSSTSGELNADGKRVVVIGGGDTAMDCVRTAVRQGATSVKCLYRRDRANMPGSPARGRECRGRGRRVRLALRAQGLHRRRGRRRDGAEDAPWRARCDGAAGAGDDRRRGLCRRRRPGDQGAGLRARGPADALGHARSWR
jgi:glutamate synthase (NADPH/NADH) small chain